MSNDSPRQLGMELLQDLADKLAEQAQQMLGVTPDMARRFAQEAAGRVADDWGGQNIYVPMDMVGRRSERNDRLYREFNGENAAELSTKYRLSIQCVYRIIKIQRRLRMPRQASLLAAPKDNDQA
jgi:Mor family transcriptional regulator